MKRLIGAVALCALASVAAISARGADTPLATVLHGRYDDMKAAMHAHDDAAVAAMLAPDFTSVDISGKSENGRAMIAEVDELQPDPNKTSTTTIMSVTQSGAIATVKQKYDMKTVKTAPDGSKRNVELLTVSTDTWLNKGGAWLLQRTETQQLDYYINGVLLAHKVRG